jgi:hypothetical protein
MLSSSLRTSAPDGGKQYAHEEPSPSIGSSNQLVDATAPDVTSAVELLRVRTHGANGSLLGRGNQLRHFVPDAKADGEERGHRKCVGDKRKRASPQDVLHHGRRRRAPRFVDSVAGAMPSQHRRLPTAVPSPLRSRHLASHRRGLHSRA